MRLILQWLLHFVVFGFLFKAFIVTSVKSLGHSPVSYLLLIAVPSFNKITENLLRSYRFSTYIRKIKGIFMICGCSSVQVRYVLTAVAITISIFCGLVPYSTVDKSAILKKPAVYILRIEGGGSRFLRNVTPYLPGGTTYITEDSNIRPSV
jgi:hypothetical protein